MEKIFYLIFGVMVVAILCLLLAFPFMWLWNGTVCLAFTITKPIEYWTAYWLMIFITCFMSGSKSSS